MRRGHPALLVAAGLLLSLVGVPAATTAQDRPVEVDVLISLTGPGGFAGQANQKSLAALETEVNAHGGIRGRPLKLVIHDDQTSPQLVVQLMNEIAARRPPVVIGPAFASLCNAVAPLVASAGPVDYCLSPTIYPARGSYVFSNGPSQADLIGAEVQYFRDRGIKRIAAITTTDATGQDADKAIDAALTTPESRRAGMVLAAHEHYALADIDVSAQVARMKAADPGAIVVWTSGTALGTFLRSLQQSGLSVPVGTSPSNMTRAQMTQYASIVPRELYFSGAPFPVGQAANRAVAGLVRGYEEAMRRNAIVTDYQTGLPWDVALIVVEALRRLGPDASPQQVRDFILGLHGFPGISGIYDFPAVPQRGLDVRNLVVMRWQPERDRWVSVTRVGGGLLR